ncbi:hypothetical protein SGLAM104S_08425 [Streptomyces glaucescens]
MPKGGDAPTHNPTQGEVADRLKMCESALSRALSGKVLPQRGSVEILFEAASADAARQDIEVGVTLADLYRLHARAAAEQKGVVASRLSTDLEAAMAPAAAGGGTTPLIPEWAAVENTTNPVKTYMTAVLNGKSPAQAAKQVEDEFNKRLAQQQ